MMLMTCPFHSERYLSGFRHVGVVDKRVSAPVPVLRRPIPGSPLFDGLGPWPYIWVTSAEDIPALSGAFGDLVTLTLVTQPGYRPTTAGCDVVHLKQHSSSTPAPHSMPSAKGHASM